MGFSAPGLNGANGAGAGIRVFFSPGGAGILCPTWSQASAWSRRCDYDATMKPLALLIRTAGTNCDTELAYGLELAGARTRTEHLNHLIAEPGLIDEAFLIAIPGGFSYGDDIAAGRIFANRLRRRLMDPLRAAIGRGVPIIGICNGFQVLVKMGLLPGSGEGRSYGQQATLAHNTSGRFLDRWVRLEVPQETVCVWTAGLGDMELPIAHGEGRFCVDSPATLQSLTDRGQVAVRYARDDNPNGSAADIAGICDPSGRVFGLMPHPERFTDPTHHPAWTRRGEAFLAQHPAGLAILEKGVQAAAELAERTSTTVAVGELAGPKAGGGDERLNPGV